MARDNQRIFFDPADRELVALVNHQMATGAGSEQIEHLFDPYLHPRGIKELAAPIHKRIAYAVIQLITSLEAGHAEERIAALRSLRDEIFNGSSSSLRHNTARVLLAIMKDLVRERGNEHRQLKLAHDFFAALSGRPSFIRSQLRAHHLVEMPEEWNQVAFDHHVHDANSKGRKSPTHLITDAWIKGIRDINVIYYNFIRTEAVAELSEAAEIMGVKLRIGIEVSARFRGKYVQFIWTPRGFGGREDFLEFIETEAVKAFFAQGQEVAAYRQRNMLALLSSFNERHLARLNETYGLNLAPIAPEQFLAFVGVGQASIAHLADHIHGLLMPQLCACAHELQAKWAANPGAEEREKIRARLELLNGLMPDRIIADYLCSDLNPGVPNGRVAAEGPEVPALLKLTPQQMVERLAALRTGYRLTLNPTGLSPADVLELVYDLEGAITHIEIYNLKDRRQGRESFGKRLVRLRRSINAGSPSAVKQSVRDIIRDFELAEPGEEERLAKLRTIQRDITRLIGFYRGTYLRSRIGSDSIGRAGTHFGMGLVVRETLPWGARRQLERDGKLRETIPVRIEARPVTAWEPRSSVHPWLDRIYARARELPLPRGIGYHRVENFVVEEISTRIEPPGNVVTLGGIDAHPSNNFRLDKDQEREREAAEPLSWRYLDTHWKNMLKVLVGFIPAFLTFYLTKDWWLLAWFGAVIWFAITGFRNVMQAVVAGGGLMLRSPMVKWNNLVSWERVTDSLLYTGFSVPLLDWLVKSLVLERGFGVSTSTAPVLLYTVMAVVNGIYLASHNTLRGLPRAAAVGNLFRAVLSIPISVTLNAVILALLTASGWEELAAMAMLQKWAAIISKVSSDLMAAFIEGAADRNLNLRIRRQDLRTKIAQVFDIHGRLEMLLPEHDVLELLSTRSKLIDAVDGEAGKLQRRLIINALDLMYFWMFQPRARYAARQLLANSTPEELRILLGMQRVLERERDITQMFLDQLVGKKFAHALAFYLDKWSIYLAEFEALANSLLVVAEKKQQAGQEPPAPALPRQAA